MDVFLKPNVTITTAQILQIQCDACGASSPKNENIFIIYSLS